MQTSMHLSNEDNTDIPSSLYTIERVTLREKLERIKYYKLTIISSPPGYGKTTTVANFVRQSGMRCAWHSVDETERDLPNLQFHSLQALEFVAPGISQLDQTVENSPQGYATYIANYIRAEVSDHILYVMDDLHQIVGSPIAEQWLQSLVELLPANSHLILISRTLPNLPLVEYIARGEVLAIGQEELRFTPRDAANLAALFDYSVPQSVLQSRVEALEGWPAGIVLSFQSLPHDLEQSILHGKQGPEFVFNSLAEALIRRQSPILSDFLLSTSVLSKLTPELCAKALGIPHGADLLESIQKRNLFVSRVSGGLVYHRLFRNFLQQRLETAYPARFVDLHNRAGTWFSAQGNYEEAFYHFVIANLIDEAIDIVNLVHRTYFNQGKFETLLRWKTLLKDNALRSPRFIYTCAMIYIDRYMFPAANQELLIAEQELKRIGDRIGLADVQMQRATIMLREGRHQDAIQLMGNLQGDETLPRLTQGQIQHLLALGYLASGELEHAITQLEPIVTLYEEKQDAYALSAVLQDLEVAYTRSGRLDDASRCLQRVVALRREIDRPDALALALNNLGYHYHQRGDYRQALITLEEGLQAASRTPRRRIESYLLWSMGDLYRDLGQFDEALQLYNRSYELSQTVETPLQRSVTLSMSILYRIQKEYHLAERLAREAVQTGDVTTESSDYLLIQAEIYATQALATLNELAFGSLEAIYNRVKHHQPSAEYVHIASLYANVAAHYGKFDRLERCLDEIAAVTPLFEGVQFLIAEITHSPLLRSFVEADKAYQLLAQKVHELDGYRQELQTAARIQFISQSIQSTTYGLRVYTLGQELVERDGVEISLSAWRSSKAKEFFFYLLFEKAKRREAISLEFWPDSSTERVRSNFHTTLYRARQALGEEVILFDGSRYQINPQLNVWCDAHELLRFVQEAKLLPAADARAEDFWRRAISLYEGELLPTFDAQWLTSHRSALQQAYLDALLGTAQSAHARGGYREAITITKQVLVIDPFSEEAYRILLASHAQLGEYKQMLYQYRQMESFFASELGIQPSRETITLVRNLIFS